MEGINRLDGRMGEDWRDESVERWKCGWMKGWRDERVKRRDGMMQIVPGKGFTDGRA